MGTDAQLPPTPEQLPFLNAICWQTADVFHFTPEEMLNRYERGWNYRDVFGEPEGAEKDFIKQLAAAFGSWINLEI
ncbi:MAG: hypothetical protein OEZ43_13470 [Gammaproteobacteria bacterium]|nr:hypothetical protein [Gammaproteobacteria bacterium]